MRIVLTSASYDVAILPEFVRHYAKLGMESIHVAVLELKPGLMQEVRDVGATCCLPVHVHPAHPRWVTTKLEAQNKDELRLRLFLKPDDWYIPADLDEFVDFGESVPSLLSRMQGHGYAMGGFIDRVSADGSISQYDPTLSIWDQYPVETHITRDVMRIDHRKVVLARGHLGVSSGHHRIRQEEHRCLPAEFPIHHFAWRAGRMEALLARKQNYERLGIDCAPLVRIMDYVAMNRGKLLAQPC